jgi:16S rRNA (uracil1498-N3)-methyltransferase
VTAVKRGRIEFELLESVPVEPARQEISLLLSLIKFPCFEWCLEKATELGVAGIVPVISGRSEKGFAEAARKRSLRWQKILLESAQQSRRLRIPWLAAPVPIERALCEASAPLKLFLSESREAKLLKEILAGRNVASVVVGIGPEGGWTQEEVSAARKADFVEASLGSNILRTETAVAAILAILAYEGSLGSL